MRKTLSIALMLVFSWLQIYQVCDASEDTIEIVSGRLETLSQKGPILHTPAAPDDDVDTTIPFVAGEVLSHSHIQVGLDLSASQTLPLLTIHPTAPVAAMPAQNLSPPGRRISADSPPVTSLVLDRSPAHSLAPPVA